MGVALLQLQPATLGSTSAGPCQASAPTTCYIGTFKLWPLDNPPAYPTSTVYIFNGQYFVCLIVEESYLIFNVMLMALM